MSASHAAPFCTDVRDRAFCEVLNEELVCALGCTEPIAVAYAAALARATLGAEPESLEVGCSGNIIKNVKSVTVPNSGGMHGIEAAATLGAVGGDAGSALEVLESVTEPDIERTRALLSDPAFCAVSLVEGVPNLYIKVRAHATGHVAEVVIAEHHTDVVYRALDDAVLEGAREQDPALHADEPNPAYELLTIDAIIGFAEDGDIEPARAALERQIELNDAISREGLGADRERLVRAVALSDLVAAHVKGYIGALSAFCGVVCAACGAGAAITWLAGGTPEQVGATIVNTLGNVGGIVCDGAKPSCAAKISAAVDAAILGHEMAMAGRGFRAGEGLIQETVEKTIASMGYVGRVGMKPTDVEILNIMIGKTRV